MKTENIMNPYPGAMKRRGRVYSLLKKNPEASLTVGDIASMADLEEKEARYAASSLYRHGLVEKLRLRIETMRKTGKPGGKTRIAFSYVEPWAQKLTAT